METTKIVIFLRVTSCNLVDIYRRFRRTCCLIIRAHDAYQRILLFPHLGQKTEKCSSDIPTTLLMWWRQQVPPKRRYVSSRLHGVTCWRSITFIPFNFLIVSQSRSPKKCSQLLITFQNNHLQCQDKGWSDTEVGSELHPWPSVSLWNDFSSPAVLLKLLLPAEPNTAGLGFKAGGNAIFIHSPAAVLSAACWYTRLTNCWPSSPYQQDRHTSTLTDTWVGHVTKPCFLVPHFWVILYRLSSVLCYIQTHVSSLPRVPHDLSVPSYLI